MIKDITDKFVMDCSAVMSLLFLDEYNKQSEILEMLFKTHAAIVPSIWHYEVSNVISMTQENKRITEANALEFKAILKTLPIITDETSTVRAIEATLSLSREHKLTVYDAAYLELAMRLGLPLATRDAQLAAAALRVGVNVI